MYTGYLTDVKGIKIGHYTDKEAKTGCTVILCDGAVGGVDVRGSAPGTRETDLLRPGNSVERIQAVVLSGGSAFGLSASGGVMKFLEEKGLGLNTGDAVVPIVCSAVIYDLGNGSSTVRPDFNAGYEAAAAASSDEKRQGLIGAGTGATVGKLLGMSKASSGGLGMSSIALPNGVVVSALVVVNALGDVYSLEDGNIIAGPVAEHGFMNTSELMLSMQPSVQSGTNTTIGVIATNAALDKASANKLASSSHDGLAVAIRPVHTMLDGDTMFALSLGNEKADMNVLCNAASICTARAINNAIFASRGAE